MDAYSRAISGSSGETMQKGRLSIFGYQVNVPPLECFTLFVDCASCFVIMYISMAFVFFAGSRVAATAG